jgi:hypothetical protein
VDTWFSFHHFTRSPGATQSASIRPVPRYDVPDASAGVQVDARLISCYQLHRHLTPTPSTRTSPARPQSCRTTPPARARDTTASARQIASRHGTVRIRWVAHTPSGLLRLTPTAPLCPAAPAPAIRSAGDTGCARRTPHGTGGQRPAVMRPSYAPLHHPALFLPRGV